MSDLSIEEQAYAHLKAWCRKHDPDGNLDPLEQIEAYYEWCNEHGYHYEQ
jgi:hypothetical protein